MEATTIAHDKDGNLSIVMVDGRSFVHGSILDSECAKRDAEIERLKLIMAEAMDPTLSLFEVRATIAGGLAWDGPVRHVDQD